MQEEITSPGCEPQENQVDLSGDKIDVVADPGLVFHLDTDEISCLGLVYGLVVDLHGIDVLFKVRGCPFDRNLIPDLESVTELDAGNIDLTEKVGYFPDQLLFISHMHTSSLMLAIIRPFTGDHKGKITCDHK